MAELKLISSGGGFAVIRASQGLEFRVLGDSVSAPLKGQGLGFRDFEEGYEGLGFEGFLGLEDLGFRAWRVSSNIHWPGVGGRA